ncbi:hypothetical protein J5TS4_09610 [Bacillus sp. J5TS4]|nr:hypothetical protein C7M26_00569 [Bacillus subtilis]GIN80383.1 hypothetical protein J5TS4_09610 [Bacillus sp. J5TS4]CAF1855944.1 hypothetical protein NRS6160_03974 [Bacillus subtilis]
MLGINVEKSNENLIINWQLSKLKFQSEKLTMYFLIQTMGERRKAQ